MSYFQAGSIEEYLGSANLREIILIGRLNLSELTPEAISQSMAKRLTNCITSAELIGMTKQDFDYLVLFIDQNPRFLSLITNIFIELLNSSKSLMDSNTLNALTGQVLDALNALATDPVKKIEMVRIDGIFTTLLTITGAPESTKFMKERTLSALSNLALEIKDFSVKKTPIPSINPALLQKTLQKTVDPVLLHTILLTIANAPESTSLMKENALCVLYDFACCPADSTTVAQVPNIFTILPKIVNDPESTKRMKNYATSILKDLAPHRKDDDAAAPHAGAGSGTQTTPFAAHSAVASAEATAAEFQKYD